MPKDTREELEEQNAILEARVHELEKEEKRLHLVIDRLHGDWVEAENKYHAKLTEDLYLEPENVEWIVNNLGELGVKVGENYFFCYKGRSIRYDADDIEGPSDDEEGIHPLKWRPVYKREFGECIHPPPKTKHSYDRGEYDPMMGRYDFGPAEHWKPIPPPLEGPKTKEDS